MKELTVSAVTEHLDQILSFVDELLEQHGCSPALQMQIDMAVEEIYVNIAHYAYNPEIGQATIRCQVTDGPPVQIIIELLDSGRPYDPLTRPDPDLSLSAQEREVGGLGVYMVKNSMDAVSYRYEDGKNILTLKKILK